MKYPRAVQLLIAFYSVRAGVYKHWFSGNSHCIKHASGTTGRMELTAQVIPSCHYENSFACWRQINKEDQ